MATPKPPVVRLDAWELRCRFNKGRYFARMKRDEFIVKRGKPRPAHSKYHLGPGGVSLQVYYIEKATGIQVARVHQLEKADGMLRWFDKPDPKDLFENGIEYHLHEGADDTKRNPELSYKQFWKRKAYGLWRRVRCFVLGPRPVTFPVGQH